MWWTCVRTDWYVGGRRRVCDHAGVHQSTPLRVFTYHLRAAASLSAAQIKSVVDQQRQRRARMQHTAVAQWRQGTLCRRDQSVLKPPIYTYFSALNLRVSLPSVLWHCCLGVRNSIQPVKILWLGADVVTASLKSRLLIFPCTIKSRSSLLAVIWHPLTRVVPEKGRKTVVVKRLWCLHGYLSGARCKWFAYAPADATATHHLLLH